jgi:hypothetical protein
MELPKQTRERLIAKLKVDDIKPETYLRYNNFLLAIYKIAKSSLISQALAL